MQYTYPYIHVGMKAVAIVKKGKFIIWYGMKINIIIILAIGQLNIEKSVMSSF